MAELLASLAMYIAPSVVVEAQQNLWAFLATRLREAGLVDVPEHLDATLSHDAAWLDPRLLLAQACGFPYVKRLRGRVHLVATPVYDAPGCDGPSMSSVIVMRADAGPTDLSGCAGLVAAINEPISNSGYNLLRAAVAPHAHGKPFFSGVVETGGHLASLEAVRKGAADLAAIDCITYDLLKRHAPDGIDGLKILAHTPSGPSLPFITRLETSDSELAALRQALTDAVTAPELAEAREILGLTGMAVLGEADYDALLALEAKAVALGYDQVW
ncbi:phosphate/phosphite/phosphonate ABC transporter substrate-binding protein [Rhizobium sp. G187]|uniref:phosphate/phosphite/phosphonate ABC transporter substrate-binding protein n=1 Tax=Rhizobium sp. G187 TaxID=3451352 RepID=UPI003EE513C5